MDCCCCLRNNRVRNKHPTHAKQTTQLPNISDATVLAVIIASLLLLFGTECTIRSSTFVGYNVRGSYSDGKLEGCCVGGRVGNCVQANSGNVGGNVSREGCKVVVGVVVVVGVCVTVGALDAVGAWVVVGDVVKVGATVNHVGKEVIVGNGVTVGIHVAVGTMEAVLGRAELLGTVVDVGGTVFVGIPVLVGV